MAKLSQSSYEPARDQSLAERRRMAAALHNHGVGQFRDADLNVLPEGMTWDFGRGEPVPIPAAVARTYAHLRRKEATDEAQSAAESEMTALASAEAAADDEQVRTGWAIPQDPTASTKTGWIDGGLV